MMKRVLSMVLLVTLLATTGCRKKSVIPDDTLADIFHDAFVVNAYIGEEKINIDSLQIYEPIFEKYGYTAKDVLYTVGNFSRRKSARLGSVVEQAISRLEQESREFAKGVVILDTIRNVAVRTFTREVYSDSLIKTSKRADSTKLHIEISPVYKGDYTITYSYKSPDDPAKHSRTAKFYFEDNRGFRSGMATISLRKSGKVNRTIVSRNASGKLVLELGKYDKENAVSKGGKNRGKKSLPKRSHSLEVSNLKVVYKPNNEDAVDSLFARYVDIKVFADGFLIKEDSLTLSPDSTRVSTTTTPDN